ncbi:MAG: hypothetical protein J6A38_05065, partial [Clostridia bacterium]|nr:hypothetical protein [Clostridia bacterium]
QAEKSQIVLERGRRITKKDILSFIAELIKGNPDDKQYQRKVIDFLVFQVFVYDDQIVTFLNFGVDKSISKIRLAETNAVLNGLQGVQTQSPIAHQERPKSSRLRSFLFKPKGLVCNHGLPCMESPLGVCHFRLNYIQLKLIEVRSTDYIHRISGDFYFKRNYPSARRGAILNFS